MYSENRYVYSPNVEIKEKDKPEGRECFELDGSMGGGRDGVVEESQVKCPKKKEMGS